MSKLTVEDLKRIRDERKGTVTIRGGIYRAKIVVHMGACGIEAGARRVMNVLLAEVDRRGLQDVTLTLSDCAGLCDREPMMTVFLEGKGPVRYGLLDEEKTRRIFEQHVMGGDPITEYALEDEGEPSREDR